MDENYPPVLKLLGQRNATDSDTLAWMAVFLFVLPILLLAGNYLRLRLVRQRNRARSFEQLEKLAAEKDLSYPEQVMIEKIADSANLNHPASLLSSVETFDRAVSTYMKKVEMLPWLEMDDQVANISQIRKKAGYQFLSPERPPISTRELQPGQKLYSLAASPKGVRLIYAELFDIDDLAIYTLPLRTSKSFLTLGKKNDIWGFFWSAGGIEYRFRTHLLKEIKRPAHYLLLKHGDDLIHNSDREVFICRQDTEVVAEWISAKTHGMSLSPNIFDRIEDPETQALSLSYVSGSGFGLTFDGRIEVDDLIRIRGGDTFPSFLEDQIGRVVKMSENYIECRFMTMDAEKHHDLLVYIASNMTVDDFKKRLKTSRRAQRSAT
jgi:hypothetical protein